MTESLQWQKPDRLFTDTQVRLAEQFNSAHAWQQSIR